VKLIELFTGGGGMTTHADPSTGTQPMVPPGGQRGSGAATLDEPETVFRFPGADDPAPGTRRLLIMSVYAALLGLAGVGVGVRGLVSSVGGGAPGWYVPVLAAAGMLSVALSIAAFLSIHRRVLPWLLLVAAAVPLACAVLLAVAY
jgi:hypothetical protein